MCHVVKISAPRTKLAVGKRESHIAHVSAPISLPQYTPESQSAGRLEGDGLDGLVSLASGRQRQSAMSRH